MHGKNGNLKRKYIYLPQAVIQITQNDTSYLHFDNRGSPVVVTDEEGSVMKQYRYYAFGDLRSQSGSFNTDYSFTGYLKEETGNHYAKMRYYEGGIGRFLRPDPLGGLNPYLYCGNDPMNFVDPWGVMEEGECEIDGSGHISCRGPIIRGYPTDYDNFFDPAYNEYIRHQERYQEWSQYDDPFGGYGGHGGGRSSYGRGGGGNGCPSRPKLEVTREAEEIKWEGGGFDWDAAGRTAWDIAPAARDPVFGVFATLVQAGISLFGGISDAEAYGIAAGGCASITGGIIGGLILGASTGGLGGPVGYFVGAYVASMPAYLTWYFGKKSYEERNKESP